MEKLDGESTVQAKHTFEHVCKSHSVTVHHCHSNNGLFDIKIFKEEVSTAGQTLSFCLVDSHYQNGNAENHIKDFTIGERTSLLKAAHQCPETIHAALWPVALNNYTNLINSLPK